MGCAERISREELNMDAPRVLITHRGWTNLDWRFVMNTLSPRVKKIYTVYALLDPRIASTPDPSAVRYIGITSDIYQRMRQHSRCAGDNKQKNAWIRDLQQEQLVFITHSIEKVSTVEKAMEREIYWIRHYTDLGAQLFNIAGMRDKDEKASSKTREEHGYVIDIRKLFFRTPDGRIVSVDEATNEEYDLFIRSQIPVSSENSWWPSYMRVNSIYHAIDHGVHIKLLVHPESLP